jgi:ATP-dependent exoDNAse (exonuclease V) beta subunit
LSKLVTPVEINKLHELAVLLSFKDDRSNINYNIWKKYLKEILDFAITNRIADLTPFKEDSIRIINAVFPVDQNLNIDIARIRSLLEQLRSLFDKDPDNPTTQERIKNIEELLSKTNLNLPDLIKVKSVLKKTTGAHKTALPGIKDYLKMLSRIYNSNIFVDPLLQFISLVFDLAQKSLNEFIVYKKTHNLIDFNDMEAYLLELLEIEVVKNEISGTFKYVFVDEFQDSSPIQFLIFSKFSNIVKKSYWVGDPKQSIYGFRGSDPELIKAIVDKISSQNTEGLNLGEPLNHSWRSTPDIVELCNSLFVPALESQIDEEFIMLEAVRPENEIDSSSLRHWHLKDNAQRGGNKNLKWDHLAESVNTLINSGTEIVDKEKSKYSLDSNHVTTLRNLKPSDITILCRSNRAVSELADALKRHGLEVESVMSNIEETLEVKLLVAALNYLQNPSDQLARAIIVLLSTKTINNENINPVKTFIEERLDFLYGEDSESLPEKKEDESDEESDEEYISRKKEWYKNLNSWKADNELLKKINRLKEDVKALSVPLLIEKLIAEGGLYDLVSLWDNPNQRKANLRALIKYAESYVERCILLGITPSVSGYISYIENSDDIKLDQSAASGDKAVKVMTYHKAKGLEWPIVILSELEITKADDASIIKSMFGVNSYRNGEINLENPFEGKSLFLLPWVFGTFNSKVPEDIANRIKELDFFEDYALSKTNEEARLLYVGYTRPRDILITTSYRNKELKWLTEVLNMLKLKFNEVQNLDDGEYDIDLYGVERGIETFVKTFSSEIEKPERLSKEVQVIAKEERPDEGYKQKYISPSEITADTGIEINLINNFNFRIETGNVTPEQEAELGNCLHNIFAFYRPDADQDEMVSTFREIISNYGLHGHLTHPEHVYDAINNLYNYLTETYGAPVKIYKELPLQMVEDGIVYRGEADLVWETESGFVLIDYKSYPGRLSNVTAAGNKFYAGKYSGQLLKYKEMIEHSHPGGKNVNAMLIYYHVLGGLVEITN